MQILDATALKATAKLSIYNNMVMSFMSWPLMVYDFPPSFILKLTKITNRYSKSWLRLTQPFSPEILYLPEGGLNLKNPSTVHKCLQLTRAHLLKNSKDP